jgi:hypothetical protein
VKPIAPLTLPGRSVEAALFRAGFLAPTGWRWPHEEPPTWRISQHLYLARGPGRTLKIGRSGSPIYRMRQLSEPGQLRSIAERLSAAPAEHRLLLVIPRSESGRERALLRLVAHERVSTEWSRGPDSELLIAALCSAAESLRKVEAA